MATNATSPQAARCCSKTQWAAVIVASPANVAFGKANPSEPGPKTGAADGIGGRR